MNESLKIVSLSSLSYLSNGSWNTFTGTIIKPMDGIKIQTNSSSFYLQYRTWNQGKTSFYPYVGSNINDYAGSSGKPIQRLQIQAYNNAGTKLTSGIIVMYRAYVDGTWLHWVSNADPECMKIAQSQFSLGGSLDTVGYYAGIADKNISGIEIHVYEEAQTGDFSGGESSASLSYMFDSSTNWNSFVGSALSNHIDGIKIQTSTSKPYYLLYKTWNEGKTVYYPAVKSTENDYAGSAGKPIQKINIQAYTNDGTKLTSDVIVMYRAYVNNEWLPWVSNADPEWMRNVKTKYSLGGTLDTGGSYAGLDGVNLSGIEIRIFEENSLNAGLDDFTGNEINLSLNYMLDSTNNWNSFNKIATASHIDGLKIQTNSILPFYLLYKTWNAGNENYYPEVSSTGNDYAGSAGKPIQRLSIHAFASDGTKLTSGVVIMYRALVEGRWLPWVSNADPEWMESVQNQYNLEGTLDVSSSYAGISNKNISGIEIRAFQGTTNYTPIDNLSGTESPATLSYMFDNSSNWQTFSKKVMASHIDGIKIQTSPSKGYYIKYQTWNEGKSNYYPEVSSIENDYAGYPGKPIQRFGLHVYRNDGTKLTTGVVVMYRAYIDGAWLPWVSNANPEWMISVQSNYNLDGTLDTSSYYAGIAGRNIGGIEIRIFEENSTNLNPVTPTGNHKIIDVPFISQYPDYPTGCESVSAVMALHHIGVMKTVATFIGKYLDISSIPFDPYQTFGGDPTKNGYGCYAPVIVKALNNVLSDSLFHAIELKNFPLDKLCSRYIDNNIPVILWATMKMDAPRHGASWTYNGRIIEWIVPEHCLLLVGYDDNHYIFNDPQVGKQTYYNKEAVNRAYAGLFSQAVVIQAYERPNIPDATGLSITQFIDSFRTLENLYVDYVDVLSSQTHPVVLTADDVALGITNFLRSQEYSGWQWFFTTGSTIDTGFVNFVKAQDKDLYDKLIPYIREENKIMLSDGDAGIIDLGHMAATIAGYLGTGLPPSFWSGWGGDLATGMNDTTINNSNKNEPGFEIYNEKSLQTIANMTIGKATLTCNYSDFCSDFDAYALQKKIASYDSTNYHPFSDAIAWYYSTEYTHRFEQIFDELNCPKTLGSLRTAIYDKMNGMLETAEFLGLLALKAKSPADDVNRACCTALANYIYSMI